MEHIFRSECLLHLTGNHPECPERLDAFRHLPNSDVPDGSLFLELVHDDQYIEKVKEHADRNIPLDTDTLISSHSFQAATAAVGASIAAADSNGFALVRPPGHHAYPNRGSGFCLFNSIAIACQHQVQQGKKVLILDIDGHQGDGTCHTFYQDPNVLFISLHQYPAFPGTGWLDEIGSGAGKGFTINIPMPPGSADDVFWSGLEFIKPIAESFDPDVVAVSAGFDAHQLDPLLQLRLSLHCYYRCGQWLSNNFKQVFAVLEGGYNLEVLPKAIDQFICGINQSAEPFSEAETLTDRSERAVFDSHLNQLQGILKEHWAI